MNNKDIRIALYFNSMVNSKYCTFNLKNEFILYSDIYIHRASGVHNIIWIYSTQTKDNKWICKRFYKIPKEFKVISISKYDKVYLSSNDYIYEWDINTEKSVKIFDNNKASEENKVINIIKLFSNQSILNYN
jgi:hypothetical protein